MWVPDGFSFLENSLWKGRPWMISSYLPHGLLDWGCALTPGPFPFARMNVHHLICRSGSWSFWASIFHVLCLETVGPNLVGGLEHGCLMTFPSYWECHHPNWRFVIFFRGVGQPPTRLLLTIINHIITININHILIVYYQPMVGRVQPPTRFEVWSLSGPGCLDLSGDQAIKLAGCDFCHHL